MISLNLNVRMAGTIYRPFAVVLLAVLCFCTQPAGAALPEEAQTALVSALDALSVEENPQAALAAGEILISQQVSQQEWGVWFADWAQRHAFTLPLARFWDYIPTQAGSSKAALRLQAGMCSVAILFTEPRRQPAWPFDVAAPSSDLAAKYLLNLLPELEAKDRDALIGVAALALQNKPLDVQTEVVVESDRTRIVLQAAAMALALAPGNENAARLDALVRISEGATGTHRSTGVRVLEITQLDEPRHKSLESVLLAFPSAAHGVSVVIVSPGPAAETACAGLISSGQILFISPTPMTANPESPVRSPFVADVVRGLARAAWDTQANLRPALMIRRNLLLARMAAAPAGEVWPEAQSAQWLSNPDDLVPSMAAAWFFGAEAMLQRAVETYAQGKREPAQSLLLLLDVMSGGKDNAIIPTFNPSGLVTNKPLRLLRVRREELTMPQSPEPGIMFDVVPYGLDAFASGWDMDGTPQTFELQELEFVRMPVPAQGF